MPPDAVPPDAVLQALDQGDRSVAGRLLPLVYEELRRLAAQKLAQQYSVNGGYFVRGALA